ncbi:Zinc finger protein 174-like protein, partial [Camelus ferus]
LLHFSHYANHLTSDSRSHTEDEQQDLEETGAGNGESEDLPVMQLVMNRHSLAQDPKSSGLFPNWQGSPSQVWQASPPNFLARIPEVLFIPACTIHSGTFSNICGLPILLAQLSSLDITSLLARNSITCHASSEELRFYHLYSIQGHDPEGLSCLQGERSCLLSPKMAAKMEITLSSQTHIQASSKQERHIIARLEDKREPALQKEWPDPELSRQNFRRFCYQEVSGPQEALSRLRQLCRQWLQPEVHTKEQILELLVLEQFLNILPPEIQARVRHRCPMSSKEIVTLVEDFHRAAKGPKQWVAVCMQGQKVLLEKTGSQLGEQELPDFQPQTPNRYPRESSLEETSRAGSQDQQSPPHWEKSPLLQEPTPMLDGTELLVVKTNPNMFTDELPFKLQLSFIT